MGETTDQGSGLGEYLRREREKRGITIEQVASATKIGVKQLHALETDRFSELPAKPFIRGFVGSYARFIGLDAKDTLTRFDQFIESKSHERPKNDSGHSGYAFEKRDGDHGRKLLSIVMGFSIFVGGVGIYFYKSRLKPHKETHLDKLKTAEALPSSASSEVTAAAIAPQASPLAQASPDAPIPSPSPVEAAAPATEPSAVPAASPSPTVSPSPTKSDVLNMGADIPQPEIKHSVFIKSLADVWVRYRVDEKTTMKFVLRQDRKLYLRARDVIRLQVSNIQSVTLNVNGRELKPQTGAASQQSAGASFVFPRQMAEKINDPFPGESPLKLTPPPSQPSASPSAASPS